MKNIIIHFSNISAVKRRLKKKKKQNKATEVSELCENGLKHAGLPSEVAHLNPSHWKAEAGGSL